MLYVERSHRTESLLTGLARRLMTPGTHPLVPRPLVVQGQGMERWIAQSVASEYGVCANTEFFFPRNLLERIFGVAERTAGGEIPGANEGWGMEALTWRLARCLADEAEVSALSPLARQLEATDRDWRLVQLADEIARLFDDYITYRPDWVERWGQRGASTDGTVLGPDEGWQAWLFQRMFEDIGPGHLADRAKAFRSLLSSGRGEAYAALENGLREAFPHALEVFAVSTLPPLYLAVLDDLSKVIDVHLSVLSPSRHYWADVWKEVKDAEASSPRVMASGSAEILLAGLGRLGSDFQKALEEVLTNIDRDTDCFAFLEEPDHLLGRVQMGLLDLGEDSGAPIKADDHSIQVHFCHGPKRELEVVKAAIRRAFEADPTLLPEDVLVMAPQIDRWVPVIEAVFGSEGEDGDGMAYRIADRGTLRRSPVAEAFIGLLSVLRGRAARTEFVDWLSLEPVRSKLGLDADEMTRLADWAARAGIRFGLDEEHRKVFDLEGEGKHTWAAGIDRGLLGHAVGFASEVFAEVFPEPLSEMVDPDLLGAIGDLQEKLAAARRGLAQSRSVADWSEWMLTLLAETLDHRDDNAHEHQLVRGALRSLADGAQTAGFDHPIPFEAMQERLRSALETSRPAQGFLSGGMTFCELVPLRAIPFRLIAVVGLSDIEFPRRQPEPSYDLMAAHPRAGDRSSRMDDRYLFLEALISARDQLILTVPARDLRDGADLPPSVVISELLDVLDARFGASMLGEGERLRDRIVFRHPLQSFSARYFGEEEKLTWLALDEESRAGAEARRLALSEGGGSERQFLTLLDSPEEGALSLGLEDLKDRVIDSTKTFARTRLGLRLPRPETSVPDFDPSELGFLERANLGTALLTDLQGGTGIEEASAKLLANPVLPVGAWGRIEGATLQKEVEALARVAASRLETQGAALSPFDFDCTLHLPEDPVLRSLGIAGAPVHLSGRLEGLWEGGRTEVAFSRMKTAREMKYWIEHLVLCNLVQLGELSVSPESILIGRPESKKSREPVICFGDVPQAKEELARLCGWALSTEAAPLPFFPRTSLAFFEKMNDEKPGMAWRAAHTEFLGGDFNHPVPPESQQGLECARIWEGVSPLDPKGEGPFLYRFEDLSLAFFGPYWKAREASQR